MRKLVLTLALSISLLSCSKEEQEEKNCNCWIVTSITSFSVVGGNGQPGSTFYTTIFTNDCTYEKVKRSGNYYVKGQKYCDGF